MGTTKRLENSLLRGKEQLEKYSGERNLAVDQEHRVKDEQNRLQKQIRQLQDDMRDLERTKVDLTNKSLKSDTEAEEFRTQNVQLTADLKIAMKRIADFQAAFEDIENSDIDSDELELTASTEDDDPHTAVNRL